MKACHDVEVKLSPLSVATMVGQPQFCTHPVRKALMEASAVANSIGMAAGHLVQWLTMVRRYR